MPSKLPMLNSGDRFAGDSSSGAVMPLFHPPLAINVVRILPCKTGNLRAFVTVTINRDLTIHNWRIVQQPGQKAWVSVPMSVWTGPDGRKRYRPLIELPEHLKGQICKAILKEWQRRVI